jgi:hypothetical protein
MKSNDISKHKMINILIPLVVVAGVIAIFKAGFNFGNWLYILLH